MPDSAEHRHQYYLAAIPFVAYFCIFAYEAGRYTYLGIPLDYLEVPVQRIAQLAFIALLCVLIGAALLTFLIALAESKSQNWSFMGKVLLWALPLVGFTALLAPELFNFLMAIGVAIVKATDTPPVLEDRTQTNLAQRRMGRLCNDLIWIALLVGSTSLLFYRAGELLQQQERTAVVDAAKPAHMIVGAYEGALIIKRFDTKTHQLAKGFMLLPAQDVEIVQVEVGPLRR